MFVRLLPPEIVLPPELDWPPVALPPVARLSDALLPDPATADSEFDAPPAPPLEVMLPEFVLAGPLVVVAVPPTVVAGPLVVVAGPRVAAQPVIESLNDCGPRVAVALLFCGFDRERITEWARPADAHRALWHTPALCSFSLDALWHVASGGLLDWFGLGDFEAPAVLDERAKLPKLLAGVVAVEGDASRVVDRDVRPFF